METFINEAVFLAEGWGRGGPPSLTAFVDLMNELEESKASLQAKYLAANFVFSGASFDKGQNPYQDFARLIRLRNEVVHQKAHEESQTDGSGNIVIQRRKVLEHFRSLGILAKYTPPPNAEYDPDRVITNWLDEISTRAMAKWACNAAAGIVIAVIESAPTEGSFRAVLETAYRETFKLVD